MFDEQARSRLRSKLDYERWALAELEKEYDIFPDRLGGTVIEDGSIAVQEIGPATARISQSRVEEIIQRLYPLVFAASYKCIDMILEWILEENTGNCTHQWGYCHKNSEINERYHTGDLQLPAPFIQNTAVFERLLRLYGELMDHRHAVVHRNDFEVANGDFTVKDAHRPPYEFNAVELFSLAKAGTVSAEALLDDSMNEVQERELKHYLDNPNFIHNQGSFGIAAPWSPIIEYRAEAIESNPACWEIDLGVVQQADESMPSTKGYYLKVVGNLTDQTICEWKIPVEAIPDRDTLELSEQSSDFDEYRI